MRTLTSLDDIFKKVLSNALESNYQHSYLCEALRDYQDSTSGSRTVGGYESLECSDCSDDGREEEDDDEDESMEVTESDGSSVNIPGIVHEHIEELRAQIGNLSEVVNDITIEYIDGEELCQTDVRPDIEGSEDREVRFVFFDLLSDDLA